MRSRSAPSDLIDFERGVPTTAEDVAVLQRVRALNRLDPRAYLAFLESFASRHPVSREVPSRHEPFSL